jgi:hypothetical protein
MKHYDVIEAMGVSETTVTQLHRGMIPYMAITFDEVCHFMSDGIETTSQKTQNIIAYVLGLSKYVICKPEKIVQVIHKKYSPRDNIEMFPLTNLMGTRIERGRLWTIEDKQSLQRMHLVGINNAQIAAVLDRSISSIDTAINKHITSKKELTC